MNKDVIYIEPEDDITDIITKIENSKQKIVALVPPKKAGVFRSIVNIKLIAKAGVNAEKAVVLVTTDPSIIKLAAATKMPVTKNLQSAPSIPNAEEIEKIEAAAQAETIVDEGGKEEVAEAEEVETLEAEAKPADKEVKEEEKAEAKKDDDKKAEAKDDEKETEAKKDDKAKDDEKAPVIDKKEPEDDKKSKKDKKSEKKVSSNPFIAWVQKHKIVLIIGGAALAALILILVWANVIAPAVTVNVTIRTTTANFSENVTFVEKLADEKASEGKFFIEQKKIESSAEVDFEATGKKNVGEKASGEIVVVYEFSSKGAVAIDKGLSVTIGGMAFVVSDTVQLSWDGKISSCENKDDEVEGDHFWCKKSIAVPVEATEPGEAYNVAASSSCRIVVGDVCYPNAAMTGGTDETITVVQQSDIDAAKEKIKTSDEKANKAKLFSSVDDDDFIIENSYSQTVGEAVSTPAVGEKVEEGKKAKLSVKTVDSVYVIDKTKMEEFIKEKAKLAEGYKIYEMNDPFIENFTKTESGYIGKLKTSYVSGPEVTAKDVVEMVKGKGLGTGRDDLTKAYSGISKVTTEVSFPWVTSFPNDENKITVNIEVEDANKDSKDTKDKTEGKQ